MGNTIEKQVYQNILSKEKKEWIRRTQLVQDRRGAIWRYVLSWPADLVKFVVTTAMAVLANALCPHVTAVRQLCRQCVSDCTLRCSQSFDECPRHEQISAPPMLA